MIEPNDPAFDLARLNATRDILKAKFLMALRGYLHDSSTYLAGVQEGLHTKDADKIMHHAHPLKSSSAALGMVELAAAAETLEQAARDILKNGTPFTAIPEMVRILEAKATYALAKINDLVSECE